MESTKKKAGRPKSEPRTGPLVLEGTQKRETILTEVSADTAQELSAYARVSSVARDARAVARHPAPGSRPRQQANPSEREHWDPIRVWRGAARHVVRRSSNGRARRAWEASGPWRAGSCLTSLIG